MNRFGGRRSLADRLCLPMDAAEAKRGARRSGVARTGTEMKKTKNLLRISELAARSGVSVSTIKHYVKEGLVPHALKTGRNMAYYDPSCVERIKLIKKIQKERFLPLDVIKRLISSGDSFGEELEIGKAILKTHRRSSGDRPVSESQIEAVTGYPRGKIAILEREGLVIPETAGGIKMYDPIDVMIIDVMKRREDAGVPMDYSVTTINIYRDAIRRAVEEDIRLFARNLMGDIPSQTAVRFITEADDLLDTFMVLYRQKMLRTQSMSAIHDLNEIPSKLALISFLPVAGRELRPPDADGAAARLAHAFCAGDYDAALRLSGGEGLPREIGPTAVRVLALLLKNETASAFELLEREMAEPPQRVFDNAVAALACIFAIAEASGFSRPFYLSKKAVMHLARVENLHERNRTIRFLAQYVCGVIYTILPDVFAVFDRGISILISLEERLISRKVRMPYLPEWLSRTIEYEVLPAVEIRVNRFLAEAFLVQGDRSSAGRRLRRIVALAQPDDEHAAWARLRLLETAIEGKVD
ncbi:MAG: MerR family transcriptional regulator [Spirochaetes bacterium]|nr:MerR family transcriptional regulator [Spirochaetota bacterium]